MEPAAPLRVDLACAMSCLFGADSVGCPDLRGKPHVAGTRSAADPDPRHHPLSRRDGGFAGPFRSGTGLHHGKGVGPGNRRASGRGDRLHRGWVVRDRDRPPGNLQLLERPGYVAVVEGVSITAGEVVLAQFELFPLSFLLDELRVTVDPEEATRRSRGYTEGNIDADQLTQASTALDLLRNRIPGLRISGGGEVGSPTTVQLRGVSSATQSNAPVVYVDGVRMADNIEQSPSFRPG